MTKYIQLTQGKIAILSDEDFERINYYNWYAQKVKHGWYAVRRGQRIPGKPRPVYYMHKEILGIGEESQVDHVSRNSLDNRRENLRISTHTQNQHNRGMFITNTTGYKGVSAAKNGKWTAVYYTESKPVHLGTFDTKEEAAAAYDKAVLERRRQFAVTNEELAQEQTDLEKIEQLPASVIKAANKRPKNLTTRNTSGYRGVSWSKDSKKWMARVMPVDPTKGLFHVGLFYSKNKAAEAFNKAELEINGDRAILNEIKEELEVLAPKPENSTAAVSKSGFRGIVLNKSGNWNCSIKSPDDVNNRIYLGKYKTRYEAVLAYNAKALELYGEDTILNNVEQALALKDTDTKYSEETAAKRQIRPIRSSSGYRCVSWSKDHKKWCASIHIKGTSKTIKIGYFADKHDAARAYNTKAIELYGDRAILNTITED